MHKSDFTYGKIPGNLVRGGHQRLLTGFTDILASCLPLLRPGANVAITTRPFRRHGHLIDFPGQIWAAAQDAGLDRKVRAAGLPCTSRPTRTSFFSVNH